MFTDLQVCLLRQRLRVHFRYRAGVHIGTLDFVEAARRQLED